MASKWRPDRFVRLAAGLTLAAGAFLFDTGYRGIMGAAGAVLVITALSDACPFNACAVKQPAEAEKSREKGRK